MSTEQGQTAVLGELRAARRRHYVEQLDVMEILYRVYVSAIFGAIALGVLAGAVEEAPATAAAIADMKTYGPAVLGLALALAILLGLRSGAHGGPLAIEAAEVQYVLLAPVDRGAALRPAALRQLRVAVLAGAVLGAVVGNFVFRRLPGSPIAWIACLALLGALFPLGVLGAALLASGRRLRPFTTTAIGIGLFAWTLADLLFGVATSPATLAGEVGTLPLQGADHLPPAVAGVALVLALAGFGLSSVGRIALEAASRRATLTAELRFSASVQDLRTVVLLRRQLASERARARPWIRLGATVPARHPVWRRAWQSFLRWPLGRVARVAAIAIAAGAATAAAWAGVTLLFVLPGALLLVAALDLVEPLAQEADHPTRRELLPLTAADLIQRHLVPSGAAMILVLLLGAGSALAFGATEATVAAATVILVPTALVLACCAAMSATNDPYRYILSPELGYAQTAAPIVIATFAVGLPILFAREASRRGGSVVSAAVSSEFLILLIGLVMTWWLGKRFDDKSTVGL